MGYSKYAVFGTFAFFAGLVVLFGTTYILTSLLPPFWFTLMTAAGFIADCAVVFPLYNFLLQKPDMDHSILTPLRLRLSYDRYKDETGKWFRKPFPMWPDYRDGCVTLRTELVEKLKENFGKSNVQLLFGESGAGKTTLATLLAFEWTESDRERDDAFFADRLKKGSTDIQAEIEKVLESTGKARSYLFVIDNVHLDKRLARYVYYNMKRLQSNGVYVLMIARCNQAVCADHLAELISEILREPQDSLAQATEIQEYDQLDLERIQKLLPTVILQFEDFESSTNRIVEDIVGSESARLNICDGAQQKLIQALISKCESSLWLLSFLLNEIMKIENCVSPSHISELTISEKLEEYYENTYDELVSEENIESCKSAMSNPDMLDSEYKNMLTTLAFFSKHEILVPTSFMNKVIDPLKPECFNLVKNYLQQYGEIVKSDQSLMLPHSTLAAPILEFSSCIINPLSLCKSLLTYYHHIEEYPWEVLKTMSTSNSEPFLSRMDEMYEHVLQLPWRTTAADLMVDGPWHEILLYRLIEVIKQKQWNISIGEGLVTQGKIVTPVTIHPQRHSLKDEERYQNSILLYTDRYPVAFLKRVNAVINNVHSIVINSDFVTSITRQQDRKRLFDSLQQEYDLLYKFREITQNRALEPVPEGCRYPMAYSIDIIRNHLKECTSRGAIYFTVIPLDNEIVEFGNIYVLSLLDDWSQLDSIIADLTV